MLYLSLFIASQLTQVIQRLYVNHTNSDELNVNCGAFEVNLAAFVYRCVLYVE